MRRVIVEIGTGKILNAIVLDGGEYTPPEGTYLVDAEKEGETGGIYDEKNKTFIRAPDIEEVRVKTDLEIKLEELQSRIEELESK